MVSLSLPEELVLLGLDARPKRLRLAICAAEAADGRPATLRSVRRALQADGLVARQGWRKFEATETAMTDQRLHRIAAALDHPGEAPAHDLDLAVMLLTAGVLSGRQRTYARRMIVSLPVGAIPPATAWLFDVTGSPTLAAFADRLLQDSPPRRTFENGAFDPGMTAGADGTHGA